MGDEEPKPGQSCIHCHEPGHLACGENLQDLLALLELATCDEW